MIRSDFGYAPLSEAQYEQIIEAGTMQGVSPIHGAANWASMDAACKARNVDPRALLSGLLWEDHFGTDPNGGVELARAFNFGGIKWPGSPGPPGWYDSGIPYPASEGTGTYAGFRDFGAFIVALCDTLNNEYCGPAFRAGDLAGAWAIYVGGPNNPNRDAGQKRVEQWQYYQRHYPPQGGGGTVADIYSEDTIVVLRRHIGESNSDMSLDPWNSGVYPNHEWGGFCEAAIEGADAAAGLPIVHRGSAAEKGDAVIAQGLAQYSWPPEHGANCLWGRNFDPSGHICKWDEDKQMFLTTLMRPSNIGYYYSDFWRQAMKCWFRPIGVAGIRRAAPPAPPPPDNVVVIDGRKYKVTFLPL
jgi:hypothetical protein